MVQDCRAGEDPNGVYPAPAQSPAWDSFRHRSGVVLKVPHCEKEDQPCLTRKHGGRGLLRPVRADQLEQSDLTGGRGALKRQALKLNMFY